MAPFSASTLRLRRQSDAPSAPLGNQATLQTELANLNAQLAGLRVQSGRLQQQIKQASEPATSSLQVKSAEVAIEMARVEGDIARVQAQIASRPAIAGTIPPRGDRGRSRSQPDPDMLAGMTFVLALAFVIPLSIAFARRLARSGGRQAAADVGEIVPRLDRLEQAVDSIAIEVERISEGQRFVTKILADQPQIQGAVNAGKPFSTP